jgi:predicted DNA-binding protein (MmcQ/YjbR family)
MNRDELREYCLSKRSTMEDFPFGKDVAVFKVVGKIFALMPIELPLRISLKCDPIRAIMLRETYSSVKPGYHLNKKNWNTVIVDGSIADDELYEMIDHSYAQVVQGLPAPQRKRLSGT